MKIYVLCSMLTVVLCVRPCEKMIPCKTNIPCAPMCATR